MIVITTGAIFSARLSFLDGTALNKDYRDIVLECAAAQANSLDQSRDRLVDRYPHGSLCDVTLRCVFK